MSYPVFLKSYICVRQKLPEIDVKCRRTPCTSAWTHSCRNANKRFFDL